MLGCSTPPRLPAAECPECSARSAYPAARPAAQGRHRARHSQIAADRPFRPAILTSYNTACSQNASGFSPAGSPLPAASARHPCWWPAPRCCPARQTGRTGTVSPAASRQRWRRSCPAKHPVRPSGRPAQLDSRAGTARRSGPQHQRQQPPHRNQQAGQRRAHQILQQHAAQRGQSSLFHRYPTPHTVLSSFSGSGTPAARSFARIFLMCCVTAVSSAVPSMPKTAS